MQRLNLSPQDSLFSAHMRGLAILVIVVGHVGAFWIYRPWSEFLHVVVPALFFLSGAVSYYSFKRSGDVMAYYRRRLLSLAVPYWTFCLVLVLPTFIALNGRLPEFSAQAFLKWLTLTPSNSFSPFEIGQIWFFHALLVVLLLSPALFLIYERNRALFTTLLLTITALAGMEMIGDVHRLFYLADNNLYTPLIHAVFFALGFVCFDAARLRGIGLLLALAGAGVAVCAALVLLGGVDIDYAVHSTPPDLYYLCGGVAALALMLALQKPLLALSSQPLIRAPLDFLHKHTYAIALVHTFAIFVAETLFGLNSPDGGALAYALTKLAVVMVITCGLAVPFTALANLATRGALGAVEGMLRGRETGKARA